MSYYSGLCVGGPADGKMIAQQGTSFRASERVDVSPVGPSAEPGGIAETITEYKWHRISKDVDLWIPETMDVNGAMLLLAANYKPEQAND